MTQKISDQFLNNIVDAIFDHALNKSGAQENIVETIRNKTGLNLDPEKRAFQRALKAACTELQTAYPNRGYDGFDESFMRNEGATVLALFLTINGAPNPVDFADAWGGTFSSGLDHNDRETAIAKAQHFLDIFEGKLKGEADLRKVMTQRNIDQQAELDRRRAEREGIAAHTHATRRAYLNWLIKRNEYLDPRGTWQTQKQVQLKLDEIYIGLRAQQDAQSNRADRKADARELAALEARLEASSMLAEEKEEARDVLFARWHEDHRRGTRETVSRSPIPLAQAADQHEQSVILGDPGCGKTTLMRYLAHQHAKALYAGESEVTLVSEQEEQQFPARFPILIRIADYAENHAWKETPLSDFLPSYFYSHECKPSGLAALLQHELRQGGCLVLLDGLDEIVEADDRRDIVRCIENFIRAYERPEVLKSNRWRPRGVNRFIITSRIAGYRSAPISAVSTTSLAHYEVEPMDTTQMAHFLQRWCRAVEDAQTPDSPAELRQEIAQREVDGIMNAIGNNTGVQRLASNPLMLRTLALIHRTGARLPQKRIELYRLAADTLARTWRPAQGVAETELVEDHLLTPMLGELAYWMHENKPTGLATEREVHEQLGTAFAKYRRIRDWDPEYPDPDITHEIDTFLRKVREHTGLFVERAPKRYGFMHLTFEEYYAARHLVARSRTRAKLIRHHLHQSRWQEPILLALGFVGLDYPREAAELLETAIWARGEEAEELGFEPSPYENLLARDYFFLLRCLGDQIPAGPYLMDEIAERVVKERLYDHDLTCFHAYHNELEQRLRYLKGSNTATVIASRLTVALKDNSDMVRVSAAQSIGELGQASSEVIVALIDSLNDDSSNVRHSATASLGELDQASQEVIAALIASLNDDSNNVRSCAAQSLRKLGKTNSEIVTSLIATLKNDEDHDVRSQVALSLGKLGQANPEIIPKILPCLVKLVRDVENDQHGKVRASAVQALRELGQADTKLISDVASCLISVLQGTDGPFKIDPYGNVRYHAVQSLGELGQTNTEMIPEILSCLISVLNNVDNDLSWDVRDRILQTLGELGQTNPEVIPKILPS
ncbi:MAG: HEAT repeat domain-containing protein, partial [Chloroflexota bacterium]